MERWTLSIHWRANQTFQQRRCTPDPLQTLLLCLEEDLGATGIRERERERGRVLAWKRERETQAAATFRWKGESGTISPKNLKSVINQEHTGIYKPRISPIFARNRR